MPPHNSSEWGWPSRRGVGRSYTGRLLGAVRKEEALLKRSIGQQATRELTVTAEMMLACADITGDYNPLHVDKEFTARTRFKRLLA